MEPIGTVRTEQHDGGHSVWARLSERNVWQCIWSTAPGNIGAIYSDSRFSWGPDTLACRIPGTPAQDALAASDA